MTPLSPRGTFLNNWFFKTFKLKATNFEMKQKERVFLSLILLIQILEILQKP